MGSVPRLPCHQIRQTVLLRVQNLLLLAISKIPTLGQYDQLALVRNNILQRVRRNICESVLNFSNEANQGCRLFSAKRKSENVCLTNLKFSGKKHFISYVLRSKMHDDPFPRITLLFILSCLARIKRVDVPNIIINMHHGSVSFRLLIGQCEAKQPYDWLIHSSL